MCFESDYAFIFVTFEQKLSFRRDKTINMTSDAIENYFVSKIR